MSNLQETSQSVLGGGIPEEVNNQEGENNQQLLMKVDALTRLVEGLSMQLDEMKKSSQVSSEQEVQEEMSQRMENRAIGRLQLRSVYGGKGSTSGGSSGLSGPLTSLTIGIGAKDQKLPKFDGSNYLQWVTALHSIGAKDLALGTWKCPQIDESLIGLRPVEQLGEKYMTWSMWQDLNTEAEKLMLSSMKRSHVDLLLNCTNAPQMYKKLKEDYNGDDINVKTKA
jgi:hypothetical protein